MLDSTGNQLTIRGYFKDLAQISDFIGQAAIWADLDERAVYAVKMAVDEACTNIIEHAYGGEGRGQILVTYRIEADGLQITIFDHGQPFSPAQIPDLDTQAPLEARRSGGMGMYFIRTLMDQVEFKFDTPQGNQLILFKRREPRP